MSKEERDALILDNMNLVYYIIKTYYPGFIHDEDVKQEGMLGLVQAAEHWDSSQSKFSTYASNCILYQIAYYFRKQKKHLSNYSLDKVIGHYDDGTDIGQMDVLVGEEDIDLTDIHFKEFFETLDDESKKIVILRQNYINREIGEILGKPRKTIDRRLNDIKEAWNKFNEDDM